MSDLDVQHDQPEVAPEPPPRPQGQPIESRFLFVDVAALRAKQLRRGAKSRLEPDNPDAAAPPPAAPARKPKAERAAMQEVRGGLVEWHLPDFKAVFDTR